MQGCAEQAYPLPGGAFRTVRENPELRGIIAAIGEQFEGPLATIREAISSLPSTEAGPTIRPHLTTALTMCDDVAELTRRYLDYIEQALALPPSAPTAVRPDELLGEIDRQVMPEAFGRGVAWSCSLDGPIRPLLTDRALALEALVEWASMAVESARPGDSVSMVNQSGRGGARGRGPGTFTLSSSADELIANLTSFREDPLFNRLVCLEEVGTDTGSRMALSFERLAMLQCEIRYLQPEGGLVRGIEFRFPGAPVGASARR